MSDLTFAELRLATLLRQPPTEAEFHQAMVLPLDQEALAKTLAASVIMADWLAAAKGIDLAQAIRTCFDPTQGIKPPTPLATIAQLTQEIQRDWKNPTKR